MMNFCVVNPDGIIENVIVCEDEATAKEWMNCRSLLMFLKERCRLSVLVLIC